MSPGSSSRARTTAAMGACSSDSSIWRWMRACSARADASWFRACAMSSLRGPATTSCTVLRRLSACAAATWACPTAASRSCWLTALPAVASLVDLNRATCRAARSASACAAARLAFAWAISSGRLPARNRSSACSWTPICAAPCANRARGVRSSSSASTAPARTLSPSRTRISEIRSVALNASDTWRMSTLPYSVSWSGSPAGRCAAQIQIAAPSATAMTIATGKRIFLFMGADLREMP